MPRTIVVGVGQNTVRGGSLENVIGPVEAMKIAACKAAEDAGCPNLLRRADSVHVVNILSWRLADPPGMLAEAIGANPSLKEYTWVGGNSPQWLANRVADRLARGEGKIALLAGCEVMRTVRLAAKHNRDIGAANQELKVPQIGINRLGINDAERDHFADRPLRMYPILESSLRAARGLSILQRRSELGRFGEEYSKVAAGNPYAWFPIARSAEEIVTPTAQNRMISFPYTKFLNAVMEVDQSAAVLMTTPETARSLGIAEEKWVYLHGGQDAHDLWHVSERPNLASSPAINAVVAAALRQADKTLDEIDFFDFYSCFPCLPALTRRVLGMRQDDPRPMTLTGGLPYFGGAGNNYVMHSIAETVQRCRRNDREFGMVTSNGYYCTKHGVGIYGKSEPVSEWSRIDPQLFQKEFSLPASVELDTEPTGQFTVEGYTVFHDRDGEPETGILCGRTEVGKRAWAQTIPGDRDVLVAMMREEWVGKAGVIARRDDKVNRVVFD